ncbi:MAG: glycosyltransferase [Candidatus Latescibacteria bacterium]|nr:glycosyltransferase [Candidatus Latescibacterota bacterium]
MRRVLVIAYLFPPLGGAGVQRTVKFVKYLPSYGWEPFVLTVEMGTHITHDDSLLREIPEDVRVYRTKSFDPEDVGGWWRRVFRKNDHPKHMGASTCAKVSERHRSRWKDHLSHVYLRALPWVFIPDQKVGWFPDACRVGERVVKQHHIDLLFSTSSPVTSHLIALRLKLMSHRPWVADFRDLWVSFPERRPVTSLHGLVERAIERWIVTKADRVIANTEAAQRVFLSDYPTVAPERFITIPNGFDEEDFNGLSMGNGMIQLTMTYTGNFYGNRNPLAFFHALLQLFALQPDLRKEITVRLIGPEDPSLRPLIHDHHLDEVVEVWPYQPHRKCVEAMASSDVLLLIDAPEFNVSVPGKVFEYLRVSRPILALVPEGATAELLRETGGATIVHPRNVAGIVKAITDIFSRHVEQKSETVPHSSVVARFERRRLTAQLSGVFNGLIERCE